MSTSISHLRISATLIVGILAGLSLPVTHAASPDEALLKKGTPDIESTIVVNFDPNGYESCGPLYTAASGTALLVKTVTGSFNVSPGGFGGERIQVTLLGGQVTYVDIPMQRTAGALQVTGIFDQYAGSLDLADLPVVALQSCVTGLSSASTLEAIGFIVKTP